MGTLTEAQMAAAQYMANEEKLAHDVYTKFAELYDVPVFERIALAEAQHETAVDFIVERHKIVDSPCGLDLGVFTNDEISALYDRLVGQGSESLEAALTASVLVEETDIGDLGRSFDGMAAALARSDAARRRMFQDAAHELKTPLTVIDATTTAILDGVYDHDDRHLETIQQQSHLLARTVDDLRTISLAESGRMPSRPGRSRCRRGPA